MLLQHGLNLRKVAARRQQHAADAHQRLGDECRNRVGAFTLDQLLEVAREPRRVVLLALAFLRAAIVVGRVGVQERRQRHVEHLVKRRQTREPRGGERRAVIALEARDDFLFLRPPDGVVVIPDELDLRVVGIGAGVAEEHAGCRERRHSHELVGQQDSRLMSLAGKEMRKRQLLDLVVGRPRDLVVAVTERGAPQPRHRFDVLLAVVVPDVHASAARQHEGPAAMQRREIRIRMQDAREVERTEVVRHRGRLGHCVLPLCRGRQMIRSTRASRSRRRR